MSLFMVLPLVAGILWLGHAGLSIARSPASRYSRWILFAALPVLAVVMYLSGGVVGFVFALIAALTWLGMILLEVFLVLGIMVWKDARATPAGPIE
jgi:putative Ca2+/H+ antiporter (TMEM165/GDT1 family)